MIATDQPTNSPSLSRVCTVQITLSDFNDNIPTFNESQYEASVTENAPEGTRVIQVEARDIDSGSNGDIRYSFLSIVGMFLRDIYSQHVS